MTVKVPDAFSPVFGFGLAVEVFSIKRRNRIGNVASMIIFLAGAAAVFLYGVYTAYTKWTRFGPAVVWNTIWPPLLISGVLFILGAISIWSVYRNVGKAVVVYDQGLAYKDHQGLKQWRWDDFRQMYADVTRHYTNSIYTGTTHIYTLVNRNDEKIILKDVFNDVEKIAGYVREKTFPIFYKQKADAYNAGDMVSFGPVKLSKDGGLTISSKNYPWDEIEEVSIQKGQLSVKKVGGKWLSGATSYASVIPNLEVLLALLDQVVGVKTE